MVYSEDLNFKGKKYDMLVKGSISTGKQVYAMFNLYIIYLEQAFQPVKNETKPVTSKDI